MTRPNRYPYTKSQWEEETTLVQFGDNTCFKLRVERNRITSEVKNWLNVKSKNLKNKEVQDDSKI